MLHARAAEVALVILVALTGCTKKQEGSPGAAAAGPAAAAAPAAAPAPAPAAAAAPAAAPAAAAAAAAPKVHLQLRSTPPGADVAVDGHPVGRTPTMTDVPVDDREHEVTFVLAGYALERYRTRAVQNGVVHATMHALPAPDAGSRR